MPLVPQQEAVGLQRWLSTPLLPMRLLVLAVRED
jgi:hypothetical protein